MLITIHESFRHYYTTRFIIINRHTRILDNHPLADINWNLEVPRVSPKTAKTHGQFKFNAERESHRDPSLKNRQMVSYKRRIVHRLRRDWRNSE